MSVLSQVPAGVCCRLAEPGGREDPHGEWAKKIRMKKLSLGCGNKRVKRSKYEKIVVGFFLVCVCPRSRTPTTCWSCLWSASGRSRSARQRWGSGSISTAADVTDHGTRALSRSIDTLTVKRKISKVFPVLPQLWDGEPAESLSNSNSLICIYLFICTLDCQAVAGYFWTCGYCFWPFLPVTAVIKCPEVWAITAALGAEDWLSFFKTRAVSQITYFFLNVYI